jgi:hypothetical protein
VTLIHDDGKAPQFADCSQVEDLSGHVLEKRILAHGQCTQPFTRQATIDLPAGVEDVFIRRHDLVHGLGNQVIQPNLITGVRLTSITSP